MRVKRWELWTSDESLSFFPEDNEQARQSAIEDGESFEWAVTARGWNSAHQAMWVYRGWGNYQPSLREDGTPHPEEEDDNYKAPD